MTDEAEERPRPWTPPDFGDWLDVGGDVAITKPRPIPENSADFSEGENGSFSWLSHVRPDGRNCGIGRVVFAPGHHVLESADPLTISPSLLCPSEECKRHGFIRAGRWEDSGSGYG